MVHAQEAEEEDLRTTCGEGLGILAADGARSPKVSRVGAAAIVNMETSMGTVGDAGSLYRGSNKVRARR